MNDATIDLILLGILLLPLVFGILVKMYQLFLNWFGKKLQKVYEDKFKSPVLMDTVQVEEYAVKLTNSNGHEYTLKAELETTRFSVYEVNISKSRAYYYPRENYETCIRLRKVYWNNGGYISFEPNEHAQHSVKNIIKLNTPVNVVDIHGNQYTVLFEGNLFKETPLAELEIREKYNKIEAFRKNATIEINNLIKEKLNYPYLAELVADYRQLLNDRYASELMDRPRPAYKAAETVQKVSRELREVKEREKLLQYQLSIYENIFPWLSDFKEFSIKDLEVITQSPNDDTDEKTLLRNWLSPTEYENLTDTDKYQLALDRYKHTHKTNWQIGIAFERYIGYKYETNGYSVKYYGATKGMEDLGRDLIVNNGNEFIVIQCKYWNKNKIIHEKHIFQLYGTMFALSLETNKPVSGLFITSAVLSDTAKLYAEKLNIKFEENVDFDKDYPCIKCNISKTTGEKIYHLPFDQQYDRIVIDYKHGERYVSTIAEAEALGFRRAFKHF